MSDFVADCRREWKRLRVPDAVADEMAADLAADLSEAAAEGVSAEEVLGPDALDPRSFAASWAAQRGVTDPRSARRRALTRSLVLAAIAVLSVAALAAGVAVLANPPSVRAMHKVTWIDLSRSGVHSAAFALNPGLLAPGGPGVHSAAIAIDPLALGMRGTPVQSERRTIDAIAWIVLIAGIVGIGLTTLYWWRVSRRQRPSQPTDTEERAAGYA